MANVEAKEKVREILKETKGRLVYTEQLLEIFLALGMSLEKANQTRKDYSKLHNPKTIEHDEFIMSVLGRDKETYDLLNMIRGCVMCKSKLYSNIMESVAMKTIASILEPTNGVPKYFFQMCMILENFAGYHPAVAVDIVEYFSKHKHQVPSHYVATIKKWTIENCGFESVAKRIVKLLKESKNLIDKNIAVAALEDNLL